MATVFGQSMAARSRGQGRARAAVRRLPGPGSRGPRRRRPVAQLGQGRDGTHPRARSRGDAHEVGHAVAVGVQAEVEAGPSPTVTAPAAIGPPPARATARAGRPPPVPPGARCRGSRRRRPRRGRRLPTLVGAGLPMHRSWSTGPPRTNPTRLAGATAGGLASRARCRALTSRALPGGTGSRLTASDRKGRRQQPANRAGSASVACRANPHGAGQVDPAQQKEEWGRTRSVPTPLGTRRSLVRTGYGPKKLKTLLVRSAFSVAVP